jgi:hypothetical protein
MKPKLLPILALGIMACIGCNQGDGVPEGADFNDPNKPVSGFKEEPPSTGAPAGSPDEAKAILDQVNKTGKP